MFDSTVVRACLGRSRGGFSTKVHLKVDLDGRPLAFHLMECQASDSPHHLWPTINEPTRFGIDQYWRLPGERTPLESPNGLIRVAAANCTIAYQLSIRN